ncbi:MAG: hypothetical protein HZA90_09575 [Verrucomicrobia bacterium]|nr:hypothetical protein [Verrucomicrobiota bacterium]
MQPCLFFLLLCLAAIPVQSCSVPVFRYALERWPASPYELFVFHRGQLSPAQQELMKRFSPDATNAMPANLVARAVDLDADPPAQLASLWGQHQSDALPAGVLVYPRGGLAQGAVWSGAFDEAAAGRLADSPFRRRLTQRLLRGESAVWILLEGGDKAKDDAAGAVLRKRLDHLQQTLKPPKLDAEDVTNRVISVAESELKIAFGLLRLSRTDPAEELLVRMLLRSEDDLAESKEPCAFPVFGRGRVLYALVGDGINDENIDEAGSFLTGPCSCIVKEENPGFDLLLAADWDRLVRLTATSESEPPELTGLTSLAAPSGADQVAGGVPAKPASSNTASTNMAVPRTASSARWSRAVLVAVGVCAGALIVGTFLVLRRKE